MGNPNVSQISAYIKPAIGTAPRAATAGSTNGASIDRLGYGSLVIVTSVGAASGTPTALAVAAKLQDSADGSTGWADVSGAALAVAAENALGKVAVDLSMVKRYVRVVDTVGFTGGTTPAVGVCSSVVLGGADTLPAA